MTAPANTVLSEVYRASAQHLAVKKLTGRDIVRTAARHNLREIQAELGAHSDIDAGRTRLNQVIAGAATAAVVAADAKRLMAEAGILTLRKDAVRGVEVLISLPAGSSIDPLEYFTKSLAWARNHFRVPVLSAVIHLDEAVPHCHVLLVPLEGGRMRGSDMVAAGDKKLWQARQRAFFEQVARGYGLTLPQAPRRLNSLTRQKAASLAYTAIVSDADLLLRPGVEAALLAVIGRDPEPLLNAFGLSLPSAPKPSRSFVEIMTKPCKPEPKQRKPIGFEPAPIPIGFASDLAENHQNLPCVGFGAELPQVSEPEAVDENVFTRCRDDDPSAHWDSERGEFVRPLKPKQSTVMENAMSEIRLGLARMDKSRSLEPAHRGRSAHEQQADENSVLASGVSPKTASAYRPGLATGDARAESDDLLTTPPPVRVRLREIAKEMQR